MKIARRELLVGAATALATQSLTRSAIGQTTKLKIGVMMPFSGTFAPVGQAGVNGFKLALSQRQNRLGGREVELINLDDESDPGRAPANATKLIKSDNVDLLFGTVHSGVALGMIKVARETGTLLVIPNAGVGAATGALCAPNVFRTSMSMWQTAHPMGKVAFDKGYRNIVTITWKYSAGEESVSAFKEGFEAAGGKIAKSIELPFPNVEFQTELTAIAAMKPDAVFCFFGGGGAVKFVKDYEAAGLKQTIPLLSSGFLTEGTLQAQGASADGLLTTLHYADDLKFPASVEFRQAYQKAFGMEPDLFAVQGYDAGTLLDIGLSAVKGDLSAKADLYKSMEKAAFDSPRGRLSFSLSHNPIQDVYLRQVKNGRNEMVSIAAKAVVDPARGCKAS